MSPRRIGWPVHSRRWRTCTAVALPILRVCQERATMVRQSWSTSASWCLGESSENVEESTAEEEQGGGFGNRRWWNVGHDKTV